MGYLIEKDGERQYIYDLELYPDWEVIAQGNSARPIDHGEWDGEKWFIPLEKLRRWKRDEVNRVRDIYETKGCMTEFGKIDTDDRSNTKAHSTVLVANRALVSATSLGIECDWTIDWTMHDDNPERTRTLNPEEMGKIAEAIGIHINKCHKVGSEIKDQISVANEETLEDIDVEAIYAAAFSE
jgi:hypothetical protein